MCVCVCVCVCVWAFLSPFLNTIFHVFLFQKNIVNRRKKSVKWTKMELLNIAHIIQNMTTWRRNGIIWKTKKKHLFWVLFRSVASIWAFMFLEKLFNGFFHSLYIYVYIYHHHHVVPPALVSLTLSCHFSLSFIASGRSSGLHPVSSHSCCMYVRGWPFCFCSAICGVSRSTSLMGWSLFLQQCPACLVRLTRIVFVMGGRWPYSWCLVGCCLQDLFNIALSILV